MSPSLPPMPDLALVTARDLARRDCDVDETVCPCDCRVLGEEVVNMNTCRRRRPLHLFDDLRLEPSSTHPGGLAIVPHARSDNEDRTGRPLHQEVYCVNDARIRPTIAVRRADNDQVEPVLFGMLR